MGERIDTDKLTHEIIDDLIYYSDRWNPERLGRIEIKLRKLEMALRRQMAYTEVEWNSRKNLEVVE